MLNVPGKRLSFRPSSAGGWEYSDDGGKVWYLTFRTEREIREMHPSIVGEVPQNTQEDDLREVFGETLDEPIPDELFEVLC